MSKVVVGMSGGVDSAVCAWILKRYGHEVIGVTLKTWGALGEDSRCCEIEDARKLAALLEIPYYSVNCMAQFRQLVTEPFVESYLKGQTPNPCIECNRYVKWEGMEEVARNLGADYVATGHYASIVQLENGRYCVKKAMHEEKDQTYMLYKLTQEQLRHTLMPLGELSKEEVRHMARAAGLFVAEKPDSQEICFVPDEDYSAFIEEHATEELPDKGCFVDREGKVLGQHKGIYAYTVGQRKGLGLAMGHPVYVTELRADKNEVVIGENEDLFHDTILCEELCFMGLSPQEPKTVFSCVARIRYHHKGEAAEVEVLPEGRCVVRFATPQRAATPGQACVMYSEEGMLLAGAKIAGTEA